MANGLYIGIGSLAKRIKSGYIGINGVARKIKKIYIGINGVARLAWQSVIQRVTSFTSSILKGSINYSNGYMTSSNYNNYYSMSLSKPLAMGNNLYSMVYSKGADGDDDEYISSGIIIIATNEQGVPLSYREIEGYSFSSSNVSPNGTSVDRYTNFGNNMIAAFCKSSSYNTSYATYYIKIMIHDYSKNLTYNGSLGSYSSEYSSYGYPGIAPVTNNSFVYIDKTSNYSNNTTTATLRMYYNVSLSRGSDGQTAISSEYGGIGIPLVYSNSIFAMCKINDVSGLIIENNYGGKYNVIIYNVNTSSSVSGSARLSITNLGEQSASSGSLYDVMQIDELNYLLYSQSGSLAILTLSNNKTSFSIGAVTTIPNISYGFGICRIGTTNTFMCSLNSSIIYNTSYLIYADVNNKTVSLIGNKNVITKDHSLILQTVVSSFPYKEKSTISLPITINSNTSPRSGSITGVINTYD